MKNLKLILAAFIVFFSLQASAQVSINVNLGSRPDWCSNYNDDVEYVYLPEIECYYDVHSSVYIYYGPRGWIRSRYLPEYCHDYDVYRGPRVVIDYRGRSPYSHFDDHRVTYYRKNYRNYRNEYYGHRNNYQVVYNDNYRRHDDDDDRGYKKEKHYYKNHGKGHGRGHGRR
jgi:hypothetical protein